MKRALVSKKYGKILKINRQKIKNKEKKLAKQKNHPKKRVVFRRGDRTPQASVNVYIHSYILYE